MTLKEKVKNLPQSPGVYLMKDSLGGIIYVGKAKNLRKRVQSYFQSSRSHPPKVEKLVNNLKDFEYIVRDTEFEAFMLECKLIKELKPIYNKLMKSPLSYTFIEIEKDERYGSIRLVTCPEADSGNIYFGPFTNKNTVERAINGLKEHCRINCSSTSKKNTPCLYHSLGQCIGMCLGDPNIIEEYQKIIDRIIALLNGSDRSILKEMDKKMQQAAEGFDFETAAKYRDYISAINTIVNKERVIEFTEANKNIVMMEVLEEAFVKLFLIKGHRVLFSEKYSLNIRDMNQLREIIKLAIFNYFKHHEGDSAEVTKDEIDEAQIIYSYLKNKNSSYIIVPQDYIDSMDSVRIDKELNRLLCSLRGDSQ